MDEQQDTGATRGTRPAGLDAAAARASEPDGAPSDELGALLAWLARAAGARTAVEIGSAAGVTGLWLLAGLEDRGVLTSVEPDAHRHGLATQAFTEAGVVGRVRAIEGDPGTVLPRLADAGYDVVLLQAADDPDHLAHAVRLVREGGLVLVRGAVPGRRARPVVAGMVDGEDASAADVLADAGLDVALLGLDAGLVLARRP